MYFRFDNREKNQLPLQRRTEGKRGKGAGWGVGGGGGVMLVKNASQIFSTQQGSQMHVRFANMDVK